MPSTAKLAQGTTLEIAGTDGANLTITAITKATSAVCSCTSPPAIGTTVVFATASGMPEIVGRIGQVTAVSAGTSFTVNIDSSAFATAATASTATPKTWVNVPNLKDWSGFDASVAENEVSNLQSLAKEFLPGLEDHGSVTCSVDLDPADAGHQAMMSAKAKQLTTYFRLTYPKAGNVKRVTAGFVKKFGESGQVDGVIKSAVEVRCTGPVNRSEVSA